MGKKMINPRPKSTGKNAAESKSGGGLQSFTPGAGHSMPKAKPGTKN